jgi:heme oxygenase
LNSSGISPRPHESPCAQLLEGANHYAAEHVGTKAQGRCPSPQYRLPGSITGLAEYKSLVERFYHFYRPLEALLGSFSEWSDAGINVAERAHTAGLAADLEALGIAPSGMEDASGDRLPAPGTFSHALGALYVIEGSTLGSQYILPQLAQVLGSGILGADTFFRGYGPQTGSFWKQLQAALDRFGVDHPERIPDVIEGAQATFTAMGSWMQP